jgi:hypothetical protein
VSERVRERERERTGERTRERERERRRERERDCIRKEDLGRVIVRARRPQGVRQSGGVRPIVAQCSTYSTVPPPKEACTGWQAPHQPNIASSDAFGGCNFFQASAQCEEYSLVAPCVKSLGCHVVGSLQLVQCRTATVATGFRCTDGDQLSAFQTHGSEEMRPGCITEHNTVPYRTVQYVGEGPSPSCVPRSFSSIVAGPSARTHITQRGAGPGNAVQNNCTRAGRGGRGDGTARPGRRGSNAVLLQYSRCFPCLWHSFTLTLRLSFVAAPSVAKVQCSLPCSSWWAYPTTVFENVEPLWI